MSGLTTASVLLNSLWQGILIAAAVQIAARILPDGMAAYRYALRWCGLLLLGLLALLSALADRPAVPDPDASVSFVPTQSIPVPIEAQSISTAWPDLLLLMALLLACCGAVLLGRLALSYAALERIKRRAKPVATHIQFDLPRQAILAESNEVSSPALAGLWRPAVLLPEEFIDRYPAAEVRAAILHEQAHLERWDDWTQFAQRLLDALLFFHPGVRGLTWGMDLDRELACDAAVLAQTGDPQSYRDCLARMVGLAEPGIAPIRLTGHGHGQTIIKRMEAMMNLDKTYSLARAFATLAGVAAIGTLLAAIGPMIVLQPSLLAQTRPQSTVSIPSSKLKSPAKPSTGKASPISPSRSATPDLDQAMRNLERDMAVVEQALQATMRETEIAMHNLEPALQAVDASIRSLESDIAAQSLGVLTTEQYKAAEAQYAEAMQRRAELEAQEIANDPEAYRRHWAATIELTGQEWNVPRSQIDAALQVLANGGRVGDALQALVPR